MFSLAVGALRDVFHQHREVIRYNQIVFGV